MICESRPSEIAHLESMSIEGYYSTVSTWLRIMEERSAAAESTDPGDRNVKSSMSAKRTSSNT